jgi:hypothetical protein
MGTGWASACKYVRIVRFWSSFTSLAGERLGLLDVSICKVLQEPIYVSTLPGMGKRCSMLT